MQQDSNSTNSFDTVETVLTFRPSKNFFETSEYIIGVPDTDRALDQHHNYCSALSMCGASVVSVPQDSGARINKMAVITDSFAIMANFPEGSENQEEMKNTATLLATRRFLKFITAPGLLDASDVLRAGDSFFINLSENTNEEGASQMAFFLTESGYEVSILCEQLYAPLDNCAVYLGRNTILIDEELAKNYSFLSYKKIVVGSDEKGAANALVVNGKLLMSAGYSKTEQALRSAGFDVIPVNISEMTKAGIGIKCLGLAMPGIPKYGEINLDTKLKKAA